MSNDIPYDDSNEVVITVTCETIESWPWNPAGTITLDVELCNHYGNPESTERDALMSRAEAGKLLSAWKSADADGAEMRTYYWVNNLDAYVIGWVDPQDGLQLQYWAGEISGGLWLEDCPLSVTWTVSE